MNVTNNASNASNTNNLNNLSSNCNGLNGRNEIIDKKNNMQNYDSKMKRNTKSLLSLERYVETNNVNGKGKRQGSKQTSKGKLQDC